jgi:hypothetical protein
MAVTAIQTNLTLTTLELKALLGLPSTYTDIDALIDRWFRGAKSMADNYIRRALDPVPYDVEEGVIEWVRYELVKHMRHVENVKGWANDPEYADARPRRGQGQRVQSIETPDGEKVQMFDPGKSRTLNEIQSSMMPDEIKKTYWAKHRGPGSY